MKFVRFLKVKSLAERETGRKIKCLRFDGWKEYFSDEFSSYLHKEGIQREFSCRYTPEQNSEDMVSAVEMPPKEEEFGALEESLISFRLSGPNERLSRNDLSDEESASIGDSVVLSPHRRLRRWLARKKKGKMQMLEFHMDVVRTKRKDRV